MQNTVYILFILENFNTYSFMFQPVFQVYINLHHKFQRVYIFVFYELLSFLELSNW